MKWGKTALQEQISMANLRYHWEDFQVQAEIHFTPTAQGKDAHDGLAACFKREARRASLKAKPSVSILNVYVLYSKAKSYFKEVQIFYFSKSDHNRYIRKLNARFEQAESVKGIMKHHSFKVLANGTLEMNHYSKVNFN